MKRIIWNVAVAMSMCLLGLDVMAEQVSRAQIKGLDEQVQEIKKDVLGITSELQLLEEKLLYPSTTQVSLFVSFANKGGFHLDALDVAIDGKDVTHHLYTAKELEALRNGGIQRIYTGNIKTGEHKLDIKLQGKSLIGGKYREDASYKITKNVRLKLVEIKLAGPGLGNGIEFKEW